MAGAHAPASARAHRLRDGVSIAIVAAIALAVSGLITALAWAHREGVYQRGLSEAVREIEHNLARQAGGVQAFVETVAAFVESSTHVSKAEFDSFMMRTAGLWPGLVAVEWQAWVPEDRLAAFERTMRQEHAEYAVFEYDATGGRMPVGSRDVHLPVVHAYSPGGMAEEPGFDLAANREWLEYKLAAVDTTEAMASPPFGIVGRGGRGLGEGFAVNDVVLIPGAAPVRERIRGFVSAVFAFRPMIDAAMSGTRIHKLHVSVRDLAADMPVYFSWTEGGSSRAALEDLRATSVIEVVGRRWEILVEPNPELFTGVVLGLPWLVLTAGLLTTVAIVLAMVWRQRIQLEREREAAGRLEIERRFRDVVDRMSGAVFVLRGDADGGGLRIVEINAAACGLAGCPCETAAGREFSEVLPGAAAAGLLEALERVRQGGEPQQLELVELVRDGETRHVSAIVFRVGRTGEICAVLHDLTPLKAVESALREARDELELALDVSRVGLWSMDVATRRVRLDSRCLRLFGTGDDVAEESVLAARVHPEDMKVVHEEMERAVREMRAYEVEYRYTLPDGTLRYLCSRGRPVRGSGTAKIVGCSWDVTERRRMEEHLRRTQRLESLGTLAGGVAHDLNNALAPVTMGLDLLRRRLSDDPEAAESIKLMQASVRRASAIVRQLIAFKRGAGDNRPQAPAHPKRILEVLGTTLVETLPKEISILIEPASLDLPRVVADEREAHQVLLNLCVNARDAMPRGGRLVVTCEGLEVGPANHEHYPELRAGNHVVFSIADNGTGIPAGIRDRVFDPFFTTKEVGKGSGLGLSTALGIVKAHRGTIQFESREGTGTTFRVILPALSDDEPVRILPAVPPKPPGEAAARVPCLLLVDDEAQVRELSRRALEQSGFKVITAGNGREAVERFAEKVQSIDAVVMDLLMPVMNGAAATAAIKRIRPDVPIVGASGFATDALVDEAKRAGISTFLPKPFTVNVLVEAVRAAMAAKRNP